mgnify:FL=1
MLIFLYGSDGYRLKESVDVIVDAYRKKHKSGVNFYRFDMEKSGDFDELLNTAKIVSFFDEVKLAVVKNSFAGKNYSQKIASLIKDMNIGETKDTVLLFAENKSKKELQKSDKDLFEVLNRKNNLIKEIEPLSGIKLSDWVKNKFKENGHSVSPAVVSLLIGMVGNEAWALANEIEKLCNYGHTEPINLDAVNLLVGSKEGGLPAQASKIFDLVDAVGNRTKAGAFEAMYRLVNSGNDPNYILVMLVYHFENLLSVSDFMKKGGSSSIQLVAKQCGLHPFVARKAVGQAGKFPEGLLLDKFNYLSGLDIASKNGQVNLEDALYNFVILS